MSEQTEQESTPLISEHHHGYRVKKEISIVRARIASTFVPAFALSSMSARESMLAQYLVNRLGSEAGYLNHTAFKPCSELVNDSTARTLDSIQSQAAEIQTYFGYTQCIPAFFTCLFIGSYSDYLGRRFLLLLPVFTTLIKHIMTSLTIRFHLGLHILYLAYGIDGLSGSWFSMLLAIYALTADICTTQKSRTFWIYFVSCASTSMEAIANITDGYLIKYYGFFEASMLLSCMAFVAFVVPFFFLPETHMHRPVTRECNPLVHMQRIFGFYFYEGSVRKKATYCLALLLFVIGVANNMSLSAIDALYQTHQPFCWSSTEIGYYNSVRGAGAYVLGAVFLKIMQRCLASEWIAMIGLLFQGSAFLFEAFIWESWQFYLVPVIGSSGSPLTSIIRTMLSMLTGPDKQGALFSSVAVVETAVGLIAVVAWNKIYGATVSFMPGFVYLVMAGCSFTTFTLFIVYMRVRDKPQPAENLLVIENPDIQ